MTLIFTDAATSPQTGIAIGAFFCLDEFDLVNYETCSAPELTTKIADQINYREYLSKKSTWAEIKTIIEALYYVEKNLNANQNIEIYTDCQSVCDLLGRRKEKLQKSHFITQSGKILQNAELYKELYSIAEKFKINVYKVKGHASFHHRKNVKEKIFSVLDKLSRSKLRTQIANK